MRQSPRLLILASLVLTPSLAMAQAQRASGSPQRTSPPQVNRAAPATGPAVNSGFAFRLGSTVTAPAGVGNINHPGTPGMQPLSGFQPIPRGMRAYPNINSPGVPPTGAATPRFQGFHPRGNGGPPGVPFVVYVPYEVYLTPIVVYGSTPAAGYEAVPTDVGTMDEGNANTEGANPAPELVYPEDSSAAATSDTGVPEQAANPPVAKPVTLLAFKNHSTVAVTDYWMDGDNIYYQTSDGGQTSVRIEALDLPLTQQLNRERNVRFVIEVRP